MKFLWVRIAELVQKLSKGRPIRESDPGAD